MTQSNSNTLSHLTDEERELLELAKKARPRTGYEAQGTGLHNAYLRYVPALLATIDQLRGELEESRKEYANIEALWGDMLNGADQVNADMARYMEIEKECAAMRPVVEAAVGRLNMQYRDSDLAEVVEEYQKYKEATTK